MPTRKIAITERGNTYFQVDEMNANAVKTFNAAASIA